MQMPIDVPPPAPRPATPSVLIVDDETGVRELMARWLAGGGYEVRTAATADEVLEVEIDGRRERLGQALAVQRIDSDLALDALLSILTRDDADAYSHAYRVAALAASVGCAMRLCDEDMAALERAALLHDVGKL